MSEQVEIKRPDVFEMPGDNWRGAQISAHVQNLINEMIAYGRKKFPDEQLEKYHRHLCLFHGMESGRFLQEAFERDRSLDKIHNILKDCFFQPGEDLSTAVIVQGFVTEFGFHPGRLLAHRDEVVELMEKNPELLGAMEILISLIGGLAKLENQ